MAEGAAPKSSWLKSLAVYGEQRTLIMLALGFSSGLPFLLIFDTLSAWLRQAGQSLETIAFFSLASLVYAFKFLWAPLVDRTHIPGLTRALGHRRSWMIVVQLCVMAGLSAIALSDPQDHVGLTAAFAVLTGFAGATQDIVIDAWRIEVAPENAQGSMAAAYQLGYRIAFIIAGAAPLFLADLYSWSLSYFAMAALMMLGISGVLLAPRETEHAVRAIPRLPGAQRPVLEAVEWIIRVAVVAVGALILGTGLTGRDLLIRTVLPGIADSFHTLWLAKGIGIWVQITTVLTGFVVIFLAARPLPGKPTQPGLFLSHALGDPVADFFRRFGAAAALIIALVCFYRISDFVLIIQNPFYLDLGFSLTQIAEIRKVYGAAMYIAGAFIGGYAIVRWGLMPCLIAGAVAMPLSNLTFAWLATVGPSSTGLMICLAFNNVAQSFAGTCLIAYMSSLTSLGFTATQYALFSSLYALPDKVIMTQSGRIIEAAARSADQGGWFAPLRTLLDAVPATSYAAGAADIGVASASLGAGYIGFYLYSCLVGLCVVPLAIITARRSAPKNSATQA